MFISEDDAARRIESESNLINKIGGETEGPSDEESAALIEEYLRVTPKRGRRHGQQNLSTETRAMVAVTTRVAGGPAAEAAFGVGAKHAYDVNQGFRGQKAREDGKRDFDLVTRTQEVIGEVHETAAERLLQAVGLVTKEKLATVNKMTDLTKVARDLASIVEKTAPRVEHDDKTVHFHVWAPPQKDEKDYEVVDVG